MKSERTVLLSALAILCGAGCGAPVDDPVVSRGDSHDLPTTGGATLDPGADNPKSGVLLLATANQFSDLLGMRVQVIGHPGQDKYDGVGVHCDWMERGRHLPMKGKEPWPAGASEGIIEVTGVLRRTPPYTIETGPVGYQMARAPGDYPGDFYLDDFTWRWLAPPPIEAPRPSTLLHAFGSHALAQEKTAFGLGQSDLDRTTKIVQFARCLSRAGRLE